MTPALFTAAAIGLALLVHAWLDGALERTLDRRLALQTGPAPLTGASSLARSFAAGLAPLLYHRPALAGAPTLLAALTPAGAWLIILAATATLPLAPPVHEASQPASHALTIFLGLLALDVMLRFLSATSAGSKYAAISGMRELLQSLGALAPLAICLLAAAAVAGSSDPAEIQVAQGGSLFSWNAMRNPFLLLALVIGMASSLALAGTAPFDSAHSTEDTAGGVLAERSSWSLALLALTRRSRLAVGSLALVIMFLGGWQLPVASWNQATFGSEELRLTQSGRSLVVGIAIIAILVKVELLSVVTRWIGMSSPRIDASRFSRVALAWLLPAAVVALVGALGWELAFPRRIWFLPPSWF